MISGKGPKGQKIDNLEQLTSYELKAGKPIDNLEQSSVLLF